MNGITILIWITIAMIAVIAIILVKLHFRGDELETEEGSILPNSFGEVISFGNDIKIENRTSTKKAPRSLSPQSAQSNKHSFFKKEETTSPKNDDYIIPDVSTKERVNYEYESQNQVLVNYDNKVEKFQEPIKQSQMDIMTQNKNKDQDTTELKDLFTIDELIKESKRKDSEREKESQTIKKDEDDKELKDIKDSIKNKTQEPLIEEIINEKEETISDLIKDTDSEDEEKTETPSITSQKDIDEAIDTASKETEQEVESISEKDEITDVLLNNEKEESEEISEPALKTPNKVDKTKAEVGEDKTDAMDLDYRKDLDKFTNKIKSSKIFQDVKEKIIPEPTETPEEETFIRNVNEYEEFEPIINETHEDFEENYGSEYDDRLRQENTRKIFNMNKAQEIKETKESSIGSIKDKPARDNIKIKLNNNEVVLKKGDEIIFNHLGETYSSQVYAINGDDISVKYRRKNITIKPSDVKKIY